MSIQSLKYEKARIITLSATDSLKRIPGVKRVTLQWRRPWSPEQPEYWIEVEVDKTDRDIVLPTEIDGVPVRKRVIISYSDDVLRPSNIQGRPKG